MDRFRFFFLVQFEQCFTDVILGEGGFLGCGGDNPLDPLPESDKGEEETGARKKRGAKKRVRLTSDEKVSPRDRK